MKLDFRAIEQPNIEIVLLDDDNTTIHVTTPTHGMVKQLESMKQVLASLDSKSDENALNKSYEFVAKLMSVNREGLLITGKALRETYRISPLSLLEFVRAYFDFIEEIKAAKNF